MSHGKKTLEGQRERDLEKAFRPKFEEYEEWRIAQQSGEPEQVETSSPSKVVKKKGFGKIDLIFLGAGFLVALLWRGCKGS